ncbi:MAG: KH domain-containing protein [Provencibacterium sp.]|jgi:spoIIIJ-associated protein|nr:KH domain-containing protein [Provencibacterium sp.]
MLRESIMTGKTVDEALRKAREELGVTSEETDFEILEMPRSSFFGLKKTPARVRVYLLEEEKAAPEPPARKPAPKEAAAAPERPREAPRLESRPEPRRAEKPLKKEKPEPLRAETHPEPRKPQPPKAKQPAERPERLERPREKPPAERPQEEASIRSKEQAPAREKNFTPQEQLSEKAKTAIQYVTDILQAMGVRDAAVRAHETPDSIDLFLEGNGLGVIIGRRGETLDAVQYLTSLVANRVDGDYVRISIDSGDYRQKRAETLERLAQKLARNAVKSGRSTRLEPMNPYERRIIHAAVSKVEGATSSSIGEEPNRRVVISPKNPRKKPEGEPHRDSSRSGPAKGGRGHDGPREAGRRSRPERPERPPRPAAPANAEKIHDSEIEIPQELAPKPLKAPQPVQKASDPPHTPTAEEKEALPLYGKIEL